VVINVFFIDCAPNLARSADGLDVWVNAPAWRDIPRAAIQARPTTKMTRRQMRIARFTPSKLSMNDATLRFRDLRAGHLAADPLIRQLHIIDRPAWRVLAGSVKTSEGERPR
jgi:hypothetical protein